ncbi:MAG: SpoIIE family protein phosphatase [Desulfosarcinaceae bacterium]|nr:SpoIIE family protein phosphatase [Desulfosarcinaceae bacterium]
MNASLGSNLWKGMHARLKRRFRIIQMGANLAGVIVCVTYFVYFDDIRPVLVSEIHYLYAVVMITAILFALGFGITQHLQQPLFQYVDRRAEGETPDTTATRRARRCLLNIPLIAGLVALFNWSLAAVAIPLAVIQLAPSTAAEALLLHFSWVFIGIVFSGVITSILIFFGQEISIRRLLPIFFPDGGVADLSGVFRVSLRIRVLLLFLMGGLLPMADMAFLAYNKARLVLTQDPHQVLQELLALLAFMLLVAGGITVLLAHYLTRSIVEPVNRLQAAMNRVAAGDLSVRAQVHDNNELGRLGDHFNRMTAGLRERYALRRTIALAREVQQTLLPQADPVVPGLEIAGRSIYCDATGGDYWDCLPPEDGADGPVGIAVGDVSGHGLPAALLMASVRAGLRQRVAAGAPASGDLASSDLAAIVADVNRQFSRDAECSGNFMTLFYLSIDRSAGELAWVRAGHDPALRYDPITDRFDTLKGEGMALGVDADTVYTVSRRDDLRAGQILLLGTDGIWEARRPDGRMLGKAPVQELLRSQAQRTAGEIVAALGDLLQRFIGPRPPEDDVTMVVVKVVA